MSAIPVTSATGATGAEPATPLLALSEISKEFPGVRALDGVDLELFSGEVHGLVGENGAGKSTLIKILGGVHPSGTYGGEIRIEGALQRYGSVGDARDAGVAIVHQELCLVHEMTVAENLVLGDEPTRFGLVDAAASSVRARAMLAPFGRAARDIDLDAPVSRLGVGQQQIIEIARALGANARVVVLDEPTAALTDGEAERLFEIVRDLKAKGVAFVYISHRLDEIFELCDRITVLRDGRRVDSRPASRLSSDRLVELMTGAELSSVERGTRSRPGDIVLRVEHLCVAHPTLAGKRVVDDLSLHVRAGEIVALAGAMGSGRTALLSTLFGAARGAVRGRVTVDGAEVTPRAPRDAIAAGLALVPEDRKGTGLVLDMTVGENLTLSALGDLSRVGVVDQGAEIRAAQAQSRSLGVKAASLAVEVRTLSGGNQQKVALGKWLMTKPKVLLLDEPTRGVDVGAKAEIYRIIRELVDDGLAVLFASSDLPEVRLLADRVLVLREGHLAGELAREEASEQAILELAVGVGSAV